MISQLLYAQSSIIIGNMKADSLWRLPTDSKPMFCFNPVCPSPLYRIFLPSTAPQHHSNTCAKWFVDAAMIIRLTNLRAVEAQPHKEEALLFTQPVHASVRFLQRRDSIRGRIENMYQEMKRSVCECIQSCKRGKLMELDLLCKDLNNFRDLILHGIAKADEMGKDSYDNAKNTSIQINLLLQSQKYKIPSFKNMELFHSETFLKKSATLKQHIIDLNSVLCREIPIQGGFQRLQFADMLGVERMLLQEREIKGDPLGELVTWSDSEILIEHNSKVTEVRCPICSYRFQVGWLFTLGKSNNYRGMLIQHLLQMHLPFLALCYSHRISRNAVRELPLSELIYIMKNYNYTQLDIYDAANTKNFHFQVQPHCFSVVFAGQNAKIDDFECCYCTTTSPEDAAFNIVILMDEVCIKQRKTVRILNFKRNYYNLYTSITTHYSLNCKFQEKAEKTPPPKGRHEKSKARLFDS